MPNNSTPILIEVADEGVVKVVGSFPVDPPEDHLAMFGEAVYACIHAQRLYGLENVQGTFYFPV